MNLTSKINTKSISKSQMAPLAVAALAAFSFEAAAVNYTADARSVTTFSGDGINPNTTVVVTPDTPFADFNTGGQNSSLGTNSISASGSGSAESDFGFSIRESVFDVSFTVDEATELTLTGNLDADGGNFGAADVTLELYFNGNLLFSEFDDGVNFDNAFEAFAINQVLEVGEYRLLADMNLTPGGGTFGSFDFQADFVAAVPVPAAAWFFGTALLGLVGSRRKA